MRAASLLLTLLVAAGASNCTLLLESAGQPGSDTDASSPEGDATSRDASADGDVGTNFMNEYECDDETIALYKFNNPSDLGLDSCTPVLHMTSAAAEPTDGRFERALNLTVATGEQGDLLLSPDPLTVVDGLTIEAWVSPTVEAGQDAERRFIVASRGESDVRFSLELQSTVGQLNEWRFRANVSGGTTCGMARQLDGPVIGVMTQQHVALTFFPEQAGTRVSLIVGGNPVDSEVIDELCAPNGGTELDVGNNELVTADKGLGHWIDELRFSRVVRVY